MFTLAFWLSGSVILDVVIMPTLYFSGMMEQAAFLPAGYAIFWFFNRLELLCAGIILTATLATRQDARTILEPLSTAMVALLLLVIALLYTYGLTPEMTALGAQFDLFSPAQPIPTAMNQMHSLYGVLEVLKLTAGVFLMSLFYRRQTVA